MQCYSLPVKYICYAILYSAVVLTGCQVPRPILVIPEGANPSKWAPQIEEFLAIDDTTPMPKGGVVFVGSSSIRLWKTLTADMQPMPVLNRGFGGSRLFDSIYYSDDLISKHEPSLVVVFSGTNDISGNKPKSAEQVCSLFRQLVRRLRWRDHKLTICNIAITPTMAREEHIPLVHEANQLIRMECEADPLLEFVDPSVDLVDADGKPDLKWFRADQLHLNRRGYAVWTRNIRPLVQRLYERESVDSK